MQKTAIIIGAGPAGLTAAYELLTRTDIKPVILEQSQETGGLSRTVVYKGNRIDIGGHRFFSKSDRVMDWWLNIMPLQPGTTGNMALTYRAQEKKIHINPDADKAVDPEKVMLLRPRRSRIYFLKKFFPYPLTVSLSTLQKLGALRTMRILSSYGMARLFPIKNVVSLQDFFINRFGKELYQTFFKSYTEKVWGVPCTELSAEWGAQRIKNLSIREALKHMIRQAVKPVGTSADIGQKGVSTSLIEQFLYPMLGPGQMWETVADKIRQMGGEILYGYEAIELIGHGKSLVSITVKETVSGNLKSFNGDLFFSTMPLKNLVAGLRGIEVPEVVATTAAGLQYRDFITVGLLVTRFSENALRQGPLLDNWIYIQDGGVELGRLQIYNNWSPGMAADNSQQWLGLEYFCNTTDPIWHKPDAELIAMGTRELRQIGLIDAADVIEGTVLRQEKTYPSYTGTYNQFNILKDFLLTIENLYPIGRNGMHRYNNSDHSMLTAMVAVDLIAAGNPEKETIWDINTEETYHEKK